MVSHWWIWIYEASKAKDQFQIDGGDGISNSELVETVKSLQQPSLLKIRFLIKSRDDANIRCHFWILRQISNQNKLWLVKTFISSVYIGSHQIKTNKKAANLIWTPHFCIIPKYDKKSYL